MNEAEEDLKPPNLESNIVCNVKMAEMSSFNILFNLTTQTSILLHYKLRPPLYQPTVYIDVIIM